MKEFTTSVEQSEASRPLGSDPITFAVDGEEWTAYPPTGGQLTLIIASMSESTKDVDRVKGILDFLDGVLDDDAKATYRERLMDRDDPFDLPDVERIINWLVEEWSGRPTQPPSGSRSSRRRTGRRSTAALSTAATTS
jgi:hypothetical protein